MGAKVIASVITKRGVRRRRFECDHCKARFTLLEGKPQPLKPRSYTIKSGIRRFTNEEVVRIITSDQPSAFLAAQYKVAKQTINGIRSGKSYRDVWLAVHPGRDPMLAGTSCPNCMHWTKDRCDFGFPESKVDLFFAQECPAFKQT